MDERNNKIWKNKTQPDSYLCEPITVTNHVCANFSGPAQTNGVVNLQDLQTAAAAAAACDISICSGRTSTINTASACTDLFFFIQLWWLVWSRLTEAEEESGVHEC